MAHESLKAEIRQYIKTNGANEITGQILQNILIDMVNEYPSLSGYATQQWVESQEYLTSADLSQYATQSWVGQNYLALAGGTMANTNRVVNMNADLLDGWHLANIVTTGHIQASTANLQSYWCKVWDMTITSYQHDDIDITFLAASAFQGLEGIIHLKIRQNGTTGAYNFEKYVKLLAGNIPLGRVKLYCNNATGKCELWMNVNQQYGVFNVSILKKTLRNSNDRATLGTLYSTDFTTVQTPPSLTDTEIVTMTAYNSLVNAVKDGDGNTITSTYLKLAGGSLTGDLTFQSGNGISVYYQYGDPSDPEYDVILIKDGVVSVGNGGDITIGGNSVATQYWVGQQGYLTSVALGGLTDVTVNIPIANNSILSFNGLMWTNVSKSTFLNGYATESWVGQNYLALSGGTMANSNLVTNMNADMLDGQHGNYYVSKNQFTTFDDVVPGFITSIEGSSVPTAEKSPFIILGGNSCTIVQCLPGHPTYGAQLAFGFNSEYLIIRNRNNTSTWSDWTKISAGYADSAGKATKDGNGNTITSTYLPLTGGNVTGNINSSDDITLTAQGKGIIFYKDDNEESSITRDVDSDLAINAARNLYLNSGNNYAIYLDGEQAASRTWVGQNYLALSGGTMKGVITLGNSTTLGSSYSSSINIELRTVSGTRADYYTYGSWIHGGEDHADQDGANVQIGTWYGFGIYPTISGMTRTQGKNSFWHNARTGNTYTWGNFYCYDGTNNNKVATEVWVGQNYLPLTGGNVTGNINSSDDITLTAQGKGIIFYKDDNEESSITRDVDSDLAINAARNLYLNSGNNYAIYLDGEQAASRTWVGQNYLALSGGTMANTNRVENMNADLLDGFHSFGETTPGLLYKYYQEFENSSTPSDDWVIKIVLDVNWWNKLTTLEIEASYSNRSGVLYLDLDSADDRWRCYHTVYSTNFVSIKRVHNTTNGNTEIYIKLKKPTEYSGSTPKGDVKIWAPVQIISMSVVSGQDIPQDMIPLYYGYNSNTPVNAGLSGWYLSNIVNTGYVASSTASLQSYWCKVWDTTITNKQYNDHDITFLVASAYQGLEGIIHLRIRQNGAANSGAYDFTKFVRLLAGNIPLDRVKLYCDNTTGKCELWMNVVGQWGVFNVSIIKKSLRVGQDEASLGTLYTTYFTEEQTPPSLTDPEIITMTSYNSLVNAVKDGDGNTITSTYLKLAGGSLTGDLTFLNGNGISVYYQYGDPSDPEYDVILIKDGVVSVGNGGDITIGGNSVATQHWVGQNYLALSGGTVNGTLLVNGNLSSQSGLYAGNSSNAYYCSIINNGSLTSISSTDGNEHYEDMEIHADSVVFDTLGSVYGDFVNTSDSRLKTILANDILPTVEQVAGAPAIRYKWNELANKKNTEAHLGSIAQYWQPILPETVVQDNKGFLAMQYDVIALVSTITLARRIIELEKELSEIKQQIKN